MELIVNKPFVLDGAIVHPPSRVKVDRALGQKLVRDGYAKEIADRVPVGETR